MLTHSVTGAFGWIILLFLTSTVTFAVVVFGVMLRRKILLWDDEWKKTLQSGS